MRAIFQREIVRRYNSGTEFVRHGSTWAIQPSLQWFDPNDHSRGAHPNLGYANHVLGTQVVYSQGTGAATTFPWPIAFTEADYGPET